MATVENPNCFAGMCHEIKCFIMEKINRSDSCYLAFMSDYCSKCSPFKELGGWDYDLFKIALKLKRGRSQSFLCEGCDNRSVYKDEDGRLYLGKKKPDGNIEMIPVNFDELQV